MTTAERLSRLISTLDVPATIKEQLTRQLEAGEIDAVLKKTRSILGALERQYEAQLQVLERKFQALVKQAKADKEKIRSTAKSGEIDKVRKKLKSL